jgi:hypothetical protein
MTKNNLHVASDCTLRMKGLDNLNVQQSTDDVAGW